MSSVTATPPFSTKLSYDPVFFDDEHHTIEPIPYRSSHSSSPESRPVDPRTPIPEEVEDETSSEAAVEPLTPTDHQQPQAFPLKMDGSADGHLYNAIHTHPPLILNTSATPLTTPTKNEGRTPTPISETRSPKTPVAKRPGTKEGGIKRAMSGLFRRSNSQSASFNLAPLSQPEPTTNGSDPMLGKEHRPMSAKRGSSSNSPYTTRSNTPPSPGCVSPTETEEKPAHLSVQEPSAEEFFSSARKKHRSATGLSLRDRLSRQKIKFAPHANEPPKPASRRHRTTSVDLDYPEPKQPVNGEVHEISRQVWGMAAETGIGLKSRRMSLNLPDDFTVDIVDLYDEYTDQSKLLGRRGKTIGKGATANVKLMVRKGCPGEVFAVKEFRGKSSNEVAEDYEKKVKSEYLIAKSLHHPNIVETFRLCTHHGRWNHVMEFCEHGDLFSLVSLKYLAKEDHQIDRVCLFKQLIQGLNYLHSNGIAHRDVKLENLLITKESKLKITDFGVSEVFSGIHPGLRSAGGQCGKEMQEVRLCAPGICGSPPYIAPEVIAKQGEYDPRPLDVWGAAIVMLCMTANGCLWEKAVPGSSPLYDELVKGWAKWNTKHSACPSACISETDYPFVNFFDNHINPPALRRVLLTMLNPDPTKRVTMAGVANNRWLKNAECCQIDSYDDPTKLVDASKSSTCKKITKTVVHNHLPPHHHHGHKLVRLPGSTDM